MARYDKIDFDFQWTGDIYLGEDGDIKDTSDDQIRSLENEIQSVVKSEFGDWQAHPTLGANISEFKGEANTRELGKRIEERVSLRLTSIGLIQAADLKVKVLPVTRHEVMIVIQVQASATAQNRLTLGEKVEVKLLYHSMEDGMFFLTPSNQERDFKKGF